MSVLNLIERRDDLAKPLLQEIELARAEIREGRFQRTMAILSAFSAVVSGYEAYSQHLRGAYSQWLMWTPVWLAPPTVAIASAALFSERVARRILPAISLVSLADGVIGFIFHLRGIGRMPGGFRLGQYNVVMGPPVFAPLLICTVGVLGLLSSMLRREIFSYQRWRAERENGWRFGWNLRRQKNVIEEVASDVAHGRFQRGLALTSAAFAVLAGGEAYFEHLRGSFNQRVMWTPIWVSVPSIVAGIGALPSKTVAQRLLPLVSMITFFDGLLGFALHLRGIYRMPGRLANFRFNTTLGPPLFAPLLFTAVGLLGLIAALLRRKE